MKKENTKEIFQRKVTENLMNVMFEKRVDTENTPEQELLNYKNTSGIKVQSVVLPREHELFTLKTEEQFLDWMGNTIHSQHTAYYQITKKYDADTEQISWNNNKTQNQRYLETSGR